MDCAEQGPNSQPFFNFHFDIFLQGFLQGFKHLNILGIMKMRALRTSNLLCHVFFLGSSLPSSASCREDRPLSSNFIADAVEIASPSVVNVKVVSQGRVMTRVMGGSGFIINREGFIITNAHVVNQATSGKVTVRLWNELIDRSATVHSYDELSDVALIKLDSSFTNSWGESDIPVSQIGSSESLRAGEIVIALGSPLALQGTVTQGIVSATARHSAELGFGKQLNEYIQTDAAINSGSACLPFHLMAFRLPLTLCFVCVSLP